MRGKYVMKVVFSVIRNSTTKKTFNTFPKEKCDSKPALNTADGLKMNTFEINFAVSLTLCTFFFSKRPLSANCCCLLLVPIYLIYLL